MLVACSKRTVLFATGVRGVKACAGGVCGICESAERFFCFLTALCLKRHNTPYKTHPTTQKIAVKNRVVFTLFSIKKVAKVSAVYAFTRAKKGRFCADLKVLVLAQRIKISKNFARKVPQQIATRLLNGIFEIAEYAEATIK